MKEYGIGVDIGGTAIKFGVFKNSGKLLKKWEAPTDVSENGKHILQNITDEIERGLMELQIEKSKVKGVGVGVPGPVGADGTVYRCVNLGWEVFNLEAELGTLLGMSIKAGNDANVAALGEMWQGGAKGYKNVVMITLGTGVGGGVIVSGQIVAGSNGAGGEIGHIRMKEDETETCGCGNYGCLEQYASASGIARQTKAYLESHDDSSALRNYERLDAQIIFDEAKKDDPVAKKMVNHVNHLLAVACVQIASVVNPDVFLIGGGMSKAGDILIDGIKEKYCQLAFHAARGTTFSIATLGNDAGIYGGMSLINML